jgi:hypothetical protein
MDTRLAMNNPTIELIEAHRDLHWRRDPDRRVETAHEAERFIEEVGFLFAMTDSRRPGPSLYTAVCGRRDAHIPRNVQKDPESSMAWRLKDEVMGRGRVYYAKVVKGLATFIAPRLVPCFNSVFGLPRRNEKAVLTQDAAAVLKVLRREWEMASSDLRTAAKIDRKRLTRALDELQRTMKVIPSDVLYEPWFTYVWSISESRFQKELSQRISRENSLREIARAFLDGAGMTMKGELARVTGLSRPDAGLGNSLLVDEGYAERIETGVYIKKTLTGNGA